MPTSRTARRRTIRRLTIVAAFVGVLAAVAAVLHTANSIQNDRMLTRARAEGIAAYQQGDLDRAVQHLSLYNARRPGDPEVTLALASARGSRPGATADDTRVAASLALTASELRPNAIDPVLLEIRFRQRLGQHTELLNAAERALAIDPASSEAATAQIRALAALGQRDDALEQALAFAGRVPDDPESHRLVLVLLTGLDGSTAQVRVRDYAAELITQHPDDPRFIILAAQAYTQVRQLELADSTVAKLTEPAIADRLEPDALASATQLLDILGRRDEADKLLRRFLDREPGSAEIAAISIERAYKQGRVDIARQRTGDALDSAEQRTPELLMWAKLSDLEAESPPEGFQAVVASGLDDLATGDAASAARHFDLALQQRPASRIALHLYGVALDRLGNPREASRIRERLLRLAPDYTIARLAHIQALLDQGRPEEAAMFAQVGLQIEPGSGGLALALAIATAELASDDQTTRTQVTQALAIAQALDEPDEATPATPVHARLLIAAGRESDAEPVIQRILTSPPVSTSAVLALAADAREAGLPIATDLLAFAEQHADENASTLLTTATAMHEDNRTEDALALVDRAARERIDDRSYQLARAVFLDRIASPEAGGQFAALFEQAPNDPATLTLILESDAAWSDQSLIQAAVTSLQSATADASDTWRFYEARRLLRFEQTEAQAAEAVRLLEPLASATASSPRVRVMLADALLRLGDTEAALNQLGLAADSGLDDPSLLLRIGWIQHARGEIQAARRRARTVAGIEPVPPAVRRERIALLATVGLLDEAESDASVLETTGTPTDLALAASIAASAGNSEAMNRRLAALADQQSLPGHVIAVAGDLLLNTGRVAQAFELIERHRPASDTAEFARAEAAVLIAAQQIERGIGRLTDAYALSAAPADAARLAQTLASNNQKDEALAIIQQALENEPESPMLTTLRDAVTMDTVAISATGANLDAATHTVAALQRHIENPQDNDRLLNDLRWITTVHPTYYPAWALLTERLREIGRIDEAAETATSAMRLMPTDARPARLAVGLMIGMNPPTKALGAAREWQSRARPDTYQADTTSAALLIRLGRVEEAAGLLERWAERIEGDTEVPPVLFRLYAASLVTSGRADTAAELFERRRARDPRWTGHHLELARDLIAYFDEPDLARAWLERSRTIAEDSPADRLRAAQASIDLADRTAKPEDLDAAIGDSTAAVEHSDASTSRSARLLLAQAHRYARSPDQAEPIARELVEEDNADPLAWMMLALAIVESDGPPDEALDAAERAIDFEGDSVILLDTLGRAQLHAQDAEAAEDTFRTAIGLDANIPGPRVGLAEALTALQRQQDAARILRDRLLRRDVEKHTLLIDRFERLQATTDRQSRFE